MSIRSFSVPLGAAAYKVYLGKGALARLPGVIRRLEAPPTRIHVITDAAVDRHHGERVAQVLAEGGFEASWSKVPAGESSKSVRQLERLWREAIRAGCDRRALVLAVGGGVVGDLAGFVAASLLRGVRFLQVPTTLLAMVDASVGGKTGINLPEGKNLVGAFHQPVAVLMDLDFLATLGARELRAGLAEVVKTALIRDAGLFRKLEEGAGRLPGGAPALLARSIERSARIKAQVVGADERESGLRMILNFGHTLAHAIEAAQGYGGLLHGEAVSVGMVFAARLGEALGVTTPGIAGRITRLLARLGLPTTCPPLVIKKLLEAMGKDKKRGARGVQWVLLEGVGRARIVDSIPVEIVKSELERFLDER